MIKSIPGIKVTFEDHQFLTGVAARRRVSVASIVRKWFDRGLAELRKSESKFTESDD